MAPFGSGIACFGRSGCDDPSVMPFVPHFKGWVSPPQRPSMWVRSPAGKSSSLIFTGMRCCAIYPRLVLGGALRRVIIQTASNIRRMSALGPTTDSSQTSRDVRFVQPDSCTATRHALSRSLYRCARAPSGVSNLAIRFECAALHSANFVNDITCPTGDRM